jgi:outer membrane protein OmpA-like peptidoglycan-associated protein
MKWLKIVMPLLYLVSQPSTMKNIITSLVLLLSCSAYSQTLVIHFDFDKYDLTPKAKLLLDSFFAVESQKSPLDSILFTGHCDFIGSDDYNDQLSLKRIATVTGYVSTKVPGGSPILVAHGYGEKMPLNQNRNAAERSLNRRVEITIVPAQQTTQVQKEEKVEPVPVKTTSPTLKERIADTAVKTGTSIALRNINFEPAKHVFLPEAYPPLQELLDILNSNPALVIEIDGHICCTVGDGDAIDVDTKTFTLSHERAKAVYSYLISKGIKAERLSYKGYAHTKPIYPYPENNEEERIANRRVEIKIISK